MLKKEYNCARMEDMGAINQFSSSDYVIGAVQPQARGWGAACSFGRSTPAIVTTCGNLDMQRPVQRHLLFGPALNTLAIVLLHLKPVI